ncbi:MAG TPA: Fpg/Nei family DNA glycosylase [candidate division WOR-3 bacterium]|uniref:Fpg/Nei family DNA glycosylase n=1 Tax=candidate division WOR-3 bacterium TaxID=2052148 RepID=A0A7C5HG76_UNCW3|nr:Fpg/Nei family DNA glycosylase [candidate division WOR-3 bacterium]
MPELPEVEVLVKNLKKMIVQRKIRDVQLIKPYILKTAKPSFRELVNRRVQDVRRRGKYIIVELYPTLFLIYHPKLTGSIVRNNIVRRDSSFALKMGNDYILFSEAGTKKISEIYLIEGIENFKPFRLLGPDPFSQEFTPQYIVKKFRGQGSWIFTMLINQRFISGIGKAYANEILFDAKISPFKPARQITTEEAENLYISTRKVLRKAIKEIEKMVGDRLLLQEKRPFTKVYRKKGKPCPVCSTEIEWVSFKDYAIYYCPNCQTGGKIFKDRRLSKFLK